MKKVLSIMTVLAITGAVAMVSVMENKHAMNSQVILEQKEINVNEENVMSEPKNFHENPIIKNIYTADPAPMVYGDTLYLYTTHDEDELINDFYTMEDWRCFSTKDMVNWEDHGVIFSLDNILT